VEHGQKTLEDWHAEYAAGTVRTGPERYGRVEEYDPVLKAHCRL
jgi:hypothetical protein